MRSRWWAPALALLLAGCFQNAVLDEGKVREATQDHFGSALAPIEIGPVVVSGERIGTDAVRLFRYYGIDEVRVVAE